MNNYDNAEPKPLKFLVSDGKLVDESGNVIAESDSLQELYIKSSPQVKKYLLSDGSVVDENNNLIIKNDYYKKVYEQAEPKVAKYLHADGTIDENPRSGGGADLEDNKEVSITENGTVEIIPSEGKDGMKKVTATVNVSGGSADEVWYCYSCEKGLTNFGYIYFPFSTPPTTETEELRESWFVLGDPSSPEITLDSEIFHGDYFNGDNFSSYEKDGNDFTIRLDGVAGPFFFTRESSKDITPSKMIALKAYKNESSKIYANPNDNTKTYILVPTGRQIMSSTYTYNSETDTYSDGSIIYSRSSVNDYYSAIDQSHIHDIPNA